MGRIRDRAERGIRWPEIPSAFESWSKDMQITYDLNQFLQLVIREAVSTKGIHIKR